ncbi:Hsp20/alpha crystallin family protein [Candidatus Gracilibacteria bacterium]|nr:Hsp20/alpha crystallin family protein [Candidatus Gracilibacteria bacterium]
MASLFKRKQANPANTTITTEKQEGQLVVDVYQTVDSIVVRTPVAGVKLADIHINISDNTLTIKGERTHADEIPEADYLLKECYWGSFSRSLVMPFTLNPEKIQAFFKDGILKIVIPHEQTKEKSITITEVSNAA